MNTLQDLAAEALSPKYWVLLEHAAAHTGNKATHIIDLAKYYITLPEVQHNFLYVQPANLSHIGRFYAGLEGYIIKLNQEAPK